jgi:hypothetical protein
VPPPPLIAPTPSKVRPLPLALIVIVVVAAKALVIPWETSSVKIARTLKPCHIFREAFIFGSLLLRPKKSGNELDRTFNPALKLQCRGYRRNYLACKQGIFDDFRDENKRQKNMDIISKIAGALQNDWIKEYPFQRVKVLHDIDRQPQHFADLHLPCWPESKADHQDGKRVYRFIHSGLELDLLHGFISLSWLVGCNISLNWLS